MNIIGQRKIVVLGMMARQPVAGIVYLTMQYLVGLRRLGYDAYYVEAHGATPKMFMESAEDGDGTEKAVAFVAGVMRRFGFSDKWAFHALHSDGRCYGLTRARLDEMYASAALLLNMHGGTTPLPEHVATGRLVYLGTDPVEREILLFEGDEETKELLRAHCALFTWGENYGGPDCGVPQTEGFDFKPTRQPVVMDLWRAPANGNGSPGRAFTTIGSWRQVWRDITFRGEVYRWSKHYEFLKFIDLPGRTGQPFELALAGCEDEDRNMLEGKGWRVRDALAFTTDLDAYRQYITGSRGEFTVAKDQNVRLRSGWFSDRSAAFLAAGRPVITQETGFSNVLPTGRGLLAFSTFGEALQAVEAINSDYDGHARAAEAVAREYFDYGVVLTRLLKDAGA
ncbi:MAG TPA: hypothetical protein VF507_08785 [Pyrinomonadaceae bacterium]|jgi:hypothetical protein